jgi:4'-phosphopantetheinyl transferase
MPFCHRIDNEHFNLGLWDLAESEAQLFQEFKSVAPENEILKAGDFKNPSRKSEWMASRLLLYKLLDKVVEIEYDINRKPSIFGHKTDISISHTKGLVALIIAKNLAGIDVETINDRVLKIEDRFLSKIEKECIPMENRLRAVLINWSAKETLYKIYGEKGLDFKKQIFISAFKPEQKGQINAEIKFQDQVKTFKLNYFIYKPKERNIEYVVVYHYT